MVLLIKTKNCLSISKVFWVLMSNSFDVYFLIIMIVHRKNYGFFYGGGGITGNRRPKIFYIYFNVIFTVHRNFTRKYGKNP